jgi:hypothetical protein
VFEKWGFGLRALYAAWDLSGSAVEVAPNNADAQSGWYVEPSYKINEKWGVYSRVSKVKAARGQDNFEQLEAGVNWWPHENVVFKADYRVRDHSLPAEALARDYDGFNLGMGYQF